MKLFVTNKSKEELNLDEMVMTTQEFADIRNHPFIATSMIDAIIIDFCEEIKLGYIESISKYVKVIPKIDHELTSYDVSLLTELYRDKAAELRYAFLLDKEKLKSIVNELKEEFSWEEYY